MARSVSRERSRSPHQEERKRDRSPRGRDDRDRPRRKDTGFKWKEKRRDDGDRRDDERSRGLDRGYRNPERDSYRPRASEGKDPEPSKKDDASPLEPGDLKKEKKEKKEKKKEKKPVIAAPAEPMIVVNINDRLGTKAAIPCYASDPISMLFSNLSTIAQ